MKHPKVSENVRDETRNGKWQLIACTQPMKDGSKTFFKLTDKTNIDFPHIHQRKGTYIVCYDNPERIPKYVKQFVARYFRHWFYPMTIPA